MERFEVRVLIVFLMEKSPGYHHVSNSVIIKISILSMGIVAILFTCLVVGICGVMVLLIDIG